MPEYSAADIVGQTLYAAKNILAYQLPVDNSPVVGQFLNGQAVGVVAGYVSPDPTKGRNYFYWQIADVYGNPKYWLRHTADSFHYGTLNEAGVQDIATKLANEALENLPWYERIIQKYGPALLITIAGVTIAAAAVKGHFASKK